MRCRHNTKTRVVGTRRERKISRRSSWLRFGFHAVVGRLTGAWVLFVESRLAMLVWRVRVHCIVTLGHAAQQLGHRRLLGTVPHPEILASAVGPELNDVSHASSNVETTQSGGYHGMIFGLSLVI